VADHRQITFLWPTAMNVAVAPAHRAERRAEISANGVNDGFAKSQSAGGIADEWRKHISFIEVNADGGAQGFLTATEENAAVDFAGAVKRGEFVIQQPRPQHEAVGDPLRLANCARLGDSLQHGGSLSPPTQTSNNSFRRK
jgi:hypothetical protein